MRRLWLVSFAALLVGLSGCVRLGTAGKTKSLTVVVMDPLAADLACDCVAGYAQRDYPALAAFLARRLGREVNLSFVEALAEAQRRLGKTPIDLVIGKRSIVVADAGTTGVPLVPVAMLTGQNGAATLHGLFVVRKDSRYQRLEDLEGKRILLGSAEASEKHAAARATLAAYGVRARTGISSSCNAAAVAVSEGEADAAVISSYAMPLLEGCGTLSAGELRIIGKTGQVPFITAFTAAAMPAAMRREVAQALLALRSRRLRKRMESRDGFVPCGPATDLPDWSDWRGVERAARSVDLPASPPRASRLLWRRPLTGLGLGGISLVDGRLYLADKDLDQEYNIWRCLDADTGSQIWEHGYPAIGEMDYSNSPRAQPVVVGTSVVVFGAFGDLRCLAATTGKVRWQRNLLKDFGAELPTWGTCSTPLVDGNRLIVNPGGKGASLAALSLATGKTLWQTPGDAAAYGNLILGTFGGVRQIVGHDAASLGGWDPKTGKRVWRLVPPVEGDFNVPTPIDLGDGTLLVCTEGNGARRYGFDGRGRIRPKPLAEQLDLNPDIATPVLLGNAIYGLGTDLLCLDAKTLEVRWQQEGAPFGQHCALLASPNYILAHALNGQTIAFATHPKRYRKLSRLTPYADDPREDREVWSHPIVVGNRLYSRDQLAISCFLLD
jgi:ABC-type phosphate/phosphonate transport system substrate-binding protein/outer membrane protein assembly factor BamB